MNKKVRALLAAALMSIALFGVSLTAFAASPARPARPAAPGPGTDQSSVTAQDPGTADTTPVTHYLDEEVVPLSGPGFTALPDEEVPLASPQTGSSASAAVVLAVLTGAGSVSLLIAGKRPEAVLK